MTLYRLKTVVDEDIRAQTRYRCVYQRRWRTNLL